MLRKINRYYSIDAACRKTALDREALLQKGAAGKVKFLVSVPGGYTLRLAKLLSGFDETGEPAGMRIPNFLELSPEDCDQLMRNGKTLVRESSLGYSYSPTYEFDILRPSECDVELFGQDQQKLSSLHDRRTLWTTWRVFKNGKPAQFEVLTKRIVLQNTEIKRLYSDYSDLDELQLSVVQHPYVSDVLKKMMLASRLFWGNAKVDPKDVTTHPKNADIAKWLVNALTDDDDNCGIKGTPAKHAASLLRPSFAIPGRRPEI